MHVIKSLAKMLLRLQHLKPDGLELQDDRINFLVEIFAHGKKRRNNLLLLGGTIQMNECVIFAESLCRKSIMHARA